MTHAIEAKPLWQPNPNTVGDTRMAMFMGPPATAAMPICGNGRSTSRKPFGRSCGIFAARSATRGNSAAAMATRCPAPAGFRRARLNYAENLLKHRDAGEALVFWGEDKGQAAPEPGRACMRRSPASSNS